MENKYSEKFNNDKKKKIAIVSIVIASIIATVLLITLLCVFLIPSQKFELTNGKYYFLSAGEMQEDNVLTIDGLNFSFLGSSVFGGNGTYEYDGEKDFTFYKDGNEYVKGMIDDGILALVINGNIYRYKYSAVKPSEITSNVDYTLGLTYSFNGTSYEVLGIGTAQGTEIKIPDIYLNLPVTKIANNAFENNTKIKSVKLGKNIVSIGDFAFSGCTSLSEVKNCENLNSLGVLCFNGTDVAFNEKNGIRYLENWAISLIDKNVTSVTIEDGTVGLYNEIFSNSKLKNVNLPSSLKYIQEKAFYPLENLTAITVDSQNKSFVAMNGGLYSLDGKTLYCLPSKSINGTLTISNSVEEIKYGALYGLNLTKLETPFIGLNANASGETALLSSMFGEASFSSGNLLTQSYAGKVAKCYVPSSLVEIKVTKPCSIKEGALSSNVNKIDDNYVSSLPLTKIDLSLATYISSNALKGLTNLNEISLPFVGETAMDSVKLFGSIFSNESYNGSVKATQFNGVNEINFYLPLLLKKVNIASTILPAFAFYGCNQLKEITFSNGAELDFYEEKDNLGNISLRRLIGVYGAFANCDSLTTINLGSNYMLEDGRLYDVDKKVLICSLKNNLDTSLTLPSTVEEICPYALTGSNITTLTISDKTKYLNDSFNKSSLENLIVPASNPNFVDFNSQGLIMTSDKKMVVFISSTLSGAVVLPSEIISLPSFDGFNITGFSFDASSSNYVAYNGLIYNKDKTLILSYAKGASGGLNLFNTLINIDFSKIGENVDSVKIVDEINVETSGEHYSSENGMVFNKTKTELLFVPKSISGNVALPDSVISISNNAFNGRADISSVLIGKNVTMIGSNAFSNIAATISFIDGNCINSISSTAFNNYLGTSLTLPNSLSSISKGMLYGAKNLESLTIPYVGESLNATGKTALFGYIFGDNSFDGATKVTQVYLSSLSSSVDYYVPNSLTNVTLLMQESLPCGAFSNLANLESVTVGYAFNMIDTAIAKKVFKGCSSFASFNVLADLTVGEGENAVTYSNKYFASQSGVLYSRNMATLIYVPNAVTAYELPSTVLNFDKTVFSDCEKLVTLTVNSSNTKFSSSGNCIIEIASSSLICGISTSVIPTDGTVVTISSMAFYYIKGLNDIVIPSSIMQVGEYAFIGCDIVTINCAAETKPDEWSDSWNKGCEATIVWGYSG